ncbi:hypothetical protein GQ43DRAFT_362154 [Delitschia confertaspora ATCC 74209]|uniref:GDSL-like protein n=1 Tax=Delitschia confertaspora ATCC 74209 TaxID=1513339 RepID=A0A9P4JXW6_9PLEO|nr:hypothetical protein GQ43DRAFT_362154 [Delitschia confertaspora ATCC 74209]
MKYSSSLLLALSAAASAAPGKRSTWSSWKDVKYLFVFGDSYTQTGFDVNGTQPNRANPLGNPTYPGWTSSNGPNWVGFLTTTYNQSYVQTYNLAYGGATVDAALVKPYTDTVLSLKNQVEDEFLPKYSSHPSFAPWKSSDSLFAVWIGINDIGNSWWLENATAITDAIFTEYDGLVEKLYKSGARNFLYLTVPPIEKSPLTVASGDWAIEHEGLAIQDWNKRVQTMANNLQKKHSDAVAFVHDTYAVFNKTLANPKAYPQTSGLKNTTNYCEAYQNGTPDWYTKTDSCGVAVNEYFWLNNLHPTFPIHNATAADIASFLKSKKRGH